MHQMAKAKHLQHGETKNNVMIVLTPTGVKGLDEQAKALGISRSELVERIGRKQIPLASQEGQLLGEPLPN